MGNLLIRRRAAMTAKGPSQEVWDIELYRDSETGVISGGGYPCTAGDTWYIEWGPFTKGYIIDGRQGGVWGSYISSENWTQAGGHHTITISKTGTMKVGQRQWSSTNDCNSEYIRIRITPGG